MQIEESSKDSRVLRQKLIHFKSQSEKERKYVSAVLRQGRKRGFSVELQIGLLTLLALLQDARWSAHTSDLLHQRFLMIVALIKAAIVKG